jgi:hypothetical protein
VVREPVALDGADITAATIVVPTTRARGRAGGLAGSVLSPTTWRHTVDFLRERTARR